MGKKEVVTIEPVEVAFKWIVGRFDRGLVTSDNMTVNEDMLLERREILTLGRHSIYDARTKQVEIRIKDTKVEVVIQEIGGD